MTSERAERRIERLLDEADQAADREDWQCQECTDTHFELVEWPSSGR